MKCRRSLGFSETSSSLLMRQFCARSDKRCFKDSAERRDAGSGAGVGGLTPLGLATPLLYSEGPRRNPGTVFPSSQIP
jgi:hypothetical protein